MESNRPILEMLKFLEAPHVLAELSRVNKQFARLSGNEELWEIYFAQFRVEHALEPFEPSSSSKEAYRRLCSSFIPVLTSNHLHKFYLSTLSWETVQLPESLCVDRCTSICLLEDRNLFVTGAPTPECDTFLIDPLHGGVTYLPHSLLHRESMGVIQHRGNVYTFCGQRNSRYTKKCEAYFYYKGLWKALPDAHSVRAAFNPTQHEEKIYLVGGCGSDEAEYYDSDTYTFTKLNFIVKEDHCSVSLWTKGELLVLQQDSYFRVREHSVGLAKKYPMRCNLGIAFWSQCDVETDGNRVFILQNYSKRIIVIDLTTWRVMKVQTPV